MKSYQRIDHKITSYKPTKYTSSTNNTRSNKENISSINYNQNNEIRRVIKPSISSSNCSLQKNKMPITPIHRNNSNTKIISAHSGINKNNIIENNNNKRKYIVTIIDRRQKFLENSKIQQRSPSFTRLPYQQKIENKSFDKSYDLGQSRSQNRIYNKNNPKIETNNKINKIPTSLVVNINENQKNISDRSNIYNNWKNNNQNNQERLSTEPKANHNIYISGSSQNKYIEDKNKKPDNPQRQILVQHKRMNSSKTGISEDLNMIENKLLRNQNKYEINKKEQKNPIYKNYIINNNKYNILNNLNQEQKNLRKPFDNLDSRKDNSFKIYIK